MLGIWLEVDCRFAAADLTWDLWSPRLSASASERLSSDQEQGSEKKQPPSSLQYSTVCKALPVQMPWSICAEKVQGSNKTFTTCIVQ